MAVMPLVPETKMADVGKLISLGKLLVRKVTWLVLTTTSATLICPAHLEPTVWQGLPVYTLVFQALTLLHCDLQGQHTHTHTHTHTYTHTLSLSLLHFDFQHSTPRKCIHSGTFFFLVLPFRLASNTTTEISSNPERDKQPKWEETRSS